MQWFFYQQKVSKMRFHKLKIWRKIAVRQKRTKRDMAYYLDIDVSTLYNWRKYKPNLYRIVMLGFRFDEMIEAQRRLGNELEGVEQEIREEIKAYECKKEV